MGPLSFIVVGVMVAYYCFNGINEWLPNYVPQRSFGIIDILYRFIRIVGTFCLSYPLIIISWHWPSILLSAGCYLLAFIIKKITRHLAYKDYL